MRDRESIMTSFAAQQLLETIFFNFSKNFTESES